jgi:hypothetical protein
MTKKACNIYLDQAITSLEKMRSAVNDDLAPDAAVDFLEATQDVTKMLGLSVSEGMSAISEKQSWKIFHLSERANRERHVAQMIASSQLEGLAPDKSDQVMLQAYIDGVVTIEDLLAHASQFATLAAYEKWQRINAQNLIDNPQRCTSTKQVMNEMQALIKRKKSK